MSKIYETGIFKTLENGHSLKQGRFLAFPPAPYLQSAGSPTPTTKDVHQLATFPFSASHEETAPSSTVPCFARQPPAVLSRAYFSQQQRDQG